MLISSITSFGFKNQSNKYHKKQILFGSKDRRVDKGLERFFQSNTNKMPITFWRYLYSLEDKNSLTPLQAQERAFASLKNAKNVQDIKDLFPDEPLFADLKSRQETNQKHKILKLAKDLEPTMNDLGITLLKNSDDLTVYLVKKLFLEAKSWKELNEDIEKDLDELFVDDFKMKYKDNLFVTRDVLKALGIKLPDQNYLNSLKFTRDGYSDKFGENGTNALKIYYKNLTPEKKEEWAEICTENLNAYKERLSEKDKQLLSISRAKKSAERWAQMSSAEKTDFLLKLKTGSEIACFTMIDAWNFSFNLLKDLSDFLTEKHLEHSIKEIYTGEPFSEYMSRIMTEFWDKHTVEAKEYGQEITNSSNRIRKAIKNGTFEQLKLEILQRREQRILELEKYKAQKASIQPIPNSEQEFKNLDAPKKFALIYAVNDVLKKNNINWEVFDNDEASFVISQLKPSATKLVVKEKDKNKTIKIKKLKYYEKDTISQFNELTKPLSEQEAKQIMRKYFPKKIDGKPVNMSDETRAKVFDFLKNHGIKGYLKIFSENSHGDYKLQKLYYDSFKSDLKDFVGNDINGLLDSENYKFIYKNRNIFVKQLQKKFPYLPAEFLKTYLSVGLGSSGVNSDDFLSFKNINLSFLIKQNDDKFYNYDVDKKNATLIEKISFLAMEKTLADILYKYSNKDIVYNMDFEDLNSIVDMGINTRKFPTVISIYTKTQGTTNIGLWKKPEVTKILSKYQKHLDGCKNWLDNIQTDKNLSKEEKLKELMFVLNPNENRDNVDKLIQKRFERYNLSDDID